MTLCALIATEDSQVVCRSQITFCNNGWSFLLSVCFNIISTTSATAPLSQNANAACFGTGC